MFLAFTLNLFFLLSDIYLVKVRERRDIVLTAESVYRCNSSQSLYRRASSASSAMTKKLQYTITMFVYIKLKFLSGVETARL
jgi:hypothetical protein